MILDNHLDVPADPDAVFALINDVERVAGCLPGATLDGREDDAYVGRVTVKVGPIKAAYAGKLRFTEVLRDERTLRLSARGSDAHGAGDAEADVVLTVGPAAGGSALDLHTDLVVRGKIAQFGKGAITTVSNRLLDQFARNLAAQLESPAAPDVSNGPLLSSDERAAPPTHADSARAYVSNGPLLSSDERAAPPTPAGGEPLDGLAMLFPPHAGRYAALVAAAGIAFAQGWLLGRLRGKSELIEELRRGR